MPIFDNINGVQRQVGKQFDNINGVWREDSKVFDNISGVWRETFSGGALAKLVGTGTWHAGESKKNLASVVVTSSGATFTCTVTANDYVPNEGYYLETYADFEVTLSELLSFVKGETLPWTTNPLTINIDGPQNCQANTAVFQASICDDNFPCEICRSDELDLQPFAATPYTCLFEASHLGGAVKSATTNVPRIRFNFKLIGQSENLVIRTYSIFIPNGAFTLLPNSANIPIIFS